MYVFVCMYVIVFTRRSKQNVRNKVGPLEDSVGNI